MSSRTIKIIKNGIYGSFGNVTSKSKSGFNLYEKPDELDDIYCTHCYSEITHWFMNTPLGCFECDEGRSENAKLFTKEEMRDSKIKNLTNER